MIDETLETRMTFDDRIARFEDGDLLHAEHFAKEHYLTVLFNATHKRWCVWDGTRYREDAIGRVIELGRETLERVLREKKVKRARQMRKEWKDARSAAATWNLLKNMLKAAESIPSIARTVSTFDRDQWLFNTLSGTIELGNPDGPGFHEHRQSDHLTMISGSYAAQEAPAPLWEEFVDWAMGGDAEMVAYLRRAVGYSLTGSTREQCLFLNWGSGANGKSTFLNIVSEMMGEYAKEMTFETILQKPNETNHRADLADLVGARFVRASEGDRGRRLSEAVVKVMTGEDKITCRRLYSDFFSYRPTFKLWLASNHRPRISGQDYGIWRRIHLIPWTQQVTPEMRRAHPNFEQELRQEINGVLRWAIDGLIDWLADGLRPPDTVRAATAAYQKDMDWIGGFLDDCCELNPMLQIPNAALYARYCEWAKQAGEMQRSQRAFSLMLMDRGFDQQKTMTGRVWLGIGLRMDEPFVPPKVR